MLAEKALKGGEKHALTLSADTVEKPANEYSAPNLAQHQSNWSDEIESLLRLSLSFFTEVARQICR